MTLPSDTDTGDTPGSAVGKAGGSGQSQAVSAPVVVWAVADNGAAAVITLQGEGAGAVGDAIVGGDVPLWWPARGLTVGGAGTPPTGTEVAVRCVVHVDREASCTRAESDLGLFAAEWVDGFVAVHASLMRVQGRVLMFPGPSFAGKTTLCVAASEAGYEVYSDEYALIDTATGLVVGWPRRLRVRTPSEGIERRDVCVDHGPMTVDLVATVKYAKDLEVPVDVTPHSPAEVTTALLANTVCAASRSELAFDATVRLARSTKGVGGRRSDAEAALIALARLAGGADTPPDR